jgi:hypothetical protein
MRCDEGAEFVSALCDGEAIPRAAAEHVKSCAGCQKRMREYLAMGAELRLMASLATEETLRPRVWSRPQNVFANWWQKGWETMKIPRLAFAILVAAVVGLGSTFAVVQVRAHSDGSIVLLKIAWPGGDSGSCPLSIQDKNQGCAFLGQMNGKSIGYEINLIGRKDDGVELAVRTKTFGSVYGTMLLEDIRKEPQKQVLFEPGQTMKLDFPGAGALTVTGEWMDHVPVFIGSSTQDVQAGPEELRLIWPMLISDKQVLGDFQGGSAISDKAGEGVAVYMPGQGRFIFALSPMRGAVQARVTGNRISFEEGGRSYVFVTGASVSRGEHLWVVHEAVSKTDDAEHGAIGSVSAEELRQLAPEVVVDGGGAKK